MTVYACYNRMFQVFHLFQTHVLSVLSGCCKSRSWCLHMLQWLHTHVSSVSCVFRRMLQTFSSECFRNRSGVVHVAMTRWLATPSCSWTPWAVPQPCPRSLAAPTPDLLGRRSWEGWLRRCAKNADVWMGGAEETQISGCTHEMSSRRRRLNAGVRPDIRTLAIP
jgi:hypothetical protein